MSPLYSAIVASVPASVTLRNCFDVELPWILRKIGTSSNWDSSSCMFVDDLVWGGLLRVSLLPSSGIMVSFRISDFTSAFDLSIAVVVNTSSSEQA